jgi:hypothetical protein
MLERGDVLPGFKRMPKLKVYRTPIGFHDAYVAATSQKAALKAWGSDADLFARGAAEVVTDAALVETPLAHPGEVIRLPRGTAAQHLKALGRAAPKARARKAEVREAEPEKRTTRAPAKRLAGTADKPRRATPPPEPTPSREDKPKRVRPRPSRAALDKAEAAIRTAEERHDAALKNLAERKRALELEQRTLRERHDAEMQRLDAAVKKAGAAFRARLEAWAAEDE